MKAPVTWGFDIDSVVGDLSGILERVAWEEFGVRVSRSQFTDFQLENCLPFEADFILRWITALGASMDPPDGTLPRSQWRR